MLRIAICDDQNHVCAQVESILLTLSKSLPEKVEVEVFYSGEALIHFLLDGAYFDMIFLDIELQMLNGVEVGRKIRDDFNNETTQIVYISAKDSYAMELFDIRPLNFLIKPLQEYKIEAVVRKAIDLVDRGNHFFEYKSGRTQNKIPIKDILYFESKGKKVRMVLQDQHHEFYSKLIEIEQQLYNQDYLFIHKSYLVNYYHVIEYQYDYVKMSDLTILPISQQQRKCVRDRLLQRRREGASC
ncbi:DNA-binding LytR/AlgR family response regulator [Paenibacillus sp. DS2015]|uniref:LytR/AlgR family response regulator transcription factor n=1 Tax=Paenibacillus sp. DS2015 TaxID=3373917 RepID=UPI003D2483FE